MNVAVCDVCGCSPCASRSFCRICREADRKAAQYRAQHNLPANWDTMSVGALWNALNDPRRHATSISVLRTAEWLVFQVKDMERYVSWLSRQSSTAQRDILAHLKKIEARTANHD